MKNSILICGLSILCMSSFAQTDSMNNRLKNNDEKHYDDKQRKDIDREYQKYPNTNDDCAVTMMNGKMMATTNGKTVMMDKEMVMKNGTVVMLDGTVKMKDGVEIKIKEGDCVDRNGSINVVKNAKIDEHQKDPIKQ